MKRISEVSVIFGIQERTLRRWHVEGLCPAQQAPGRKRWLYYDDYALRRVALVMELREFMGLRKIHRVLGAVRRSGLLVEGEEVLE